MWDLIGKVLTALVRYDSEDHHVQLAWRRTVAALLIALLVAGIGSLSWAQGWIPGVVGVATKSDVAAAKNDVGNEIAPLAASINKLSKRVDSIELLNVRQAIKQSLHDACIAVEQNNQPALDAANSDFDAAVVQYQRLAGHDYARPSCDTVLIRPNK